jgi:hypothetical protein
MRELHNIEDLLNSNLEYYLEQIVGHFTIQLRTAHKRKGIIYINQLIDKSINQQID